MISYDTQVRVRYADTDQMAFVYYGKYPEYFEVGRVETIRALGIPYTVIEANGIFMVVAEMHIDYKSPALYDNLLTIRTIIPEKPRSYFLTKYEIYDEQGKHLVNGMVKLAFFSKERKRPVRVPGFVAEAIDRHWVE